MPDAPHDGSSSGVALLALAMTGVAIAAALSVAAAWGLRALRLPGAGVLAGIAVGALLGPFLLGRVAPEAQCQLFEGPAARREAWIVAERSVAGARIAAAAASANADDEITRATAEAADAKAAWEQARAEHQRPRNVSLLVASCVLLGSMFSRGARPARPRLDVILLGAWIAVVPAVLALVLCALLGHTPFAAASLWCVALASCGAWSVARAERAIARGCGAGADRTAATAGMVATAAALVVAAVATYASAGQLTVAVAASVATALAALLLRRVRPAVGIVAERIMVPAAVALSLVSVDLAREWSIALVLGLFVVAEDGRWLGAWLGRLLGGHAAGASMRFALIGLGVAPTMVAVTTLGAASGALPGAFVLGGVVSAFLIEALAATRFRVSLRLADLGSV